MKNHILLLIYLLSMSLPLCAVDIDATDTCNYGLHFNSHSVMVGERTSLFLDNGEPYHLTDELTIQFDLFMRNGVLFGQILTARTDAGKCIFLTVLTSENDERLPALVIDEQVYELAPGMKVGEWFPVSMTFYPKTNTISVNYDGKVKKITYPLESVKSLDLFFGIRLDLVSEIPPMNLRNVRILKDGQPFRHWKLEQHNQNICYDELQRAPAVAVNPCWLIDNHIKWTEMLSLKAEDLLGTTFDPQTGTFYLVARNNILEFNAIANKKNYLPVKGGYPAMEAISHFAYDTVGRKLLSYSLHQKLLSTYSLESNKWSSQTKNTEEPRYFNHSRAYSEADSSYYMFGGYGFYKFHNDLYKMIPSTGRVEMIDYQPAIPPRTFAAAGVVGKTLYIFGGRGNESGKQEIMSHNYYDLYAVDLETRKSRKLWTLPDSVSINMTLSSTMHYVPQDSAFYVGMMSLGGRIMKLSLKDSTYTVVSYAIENKLDFQEVDFDLYFAPSFNMMFALFDKVQKGGLHNVSIYSISWPLKSEEDIMQMTEEEETGSYATWWKWLGAVMMLALLGAGSYVFVSRRRKKVILEPTAEQPEVAQHPFEREDSSEGEVMIQPHAEVKKFFDRSKSSVSLLGVFNVKDKDGKNITSNFTPRLKNLLVILVLYSQKYEQGILIKKLDELLWMDKDEVSARNNRNVSLRKLRVLLSTVGDIEIINDVGFLRIKFGEDVFCDYLAGCDCVKEFKEYSEKRDKEVLYKILEILLYGPLLPNTITDWLDDFKAAYSTQSIDLLNDLLAAEKQGSDSDLILRIADVMFLHDPLNEEALIAKCKVLCAAGKKGIAKNVYDKFAKEYKEMLGEEYKTPFSDLFKL